jgi:hypothetical protein
MHRQHGRFVGTLEAETDLQRAIREQGVLIKVALFGDMRQSLPQFSAHPDHLALVARLAHPKKFLQHLSNKNFLF